MASSFLLLLLSCAVITVVSAQIRGSNITLGSTLTPNSSWPSPSGLFAFGFFPQKIMSYAVGVFLPGTPNKTVVWTANWDNPTVPNNAVLQLTEDGRLVLVGQGGQRSIYVVDLSQPIAWASMLDNGNFVLYGSESSVIWQSFDNPTDTLLPGQRLGPGTGLFSSASETDHSKGIFTLQMQTDGDLVQYPGDGTRIQENSYYATGTYKPKDSNISLNLDNNGWLYLLDGASWLQNLTAGGYVKERSIYLMRLDVGGIFRLYSRPLNGQGMWTTRWSSTNELCAPKGLCGLNAFCVQNDVVLECKCLPGFDFVAPGNWSAGCERNFTFERCDGEKFDMIPVENTIWEDNSYNELDALTEQDCGKACLDDCNCEVAFLKEGKCRKQKLPLRYGRRLLSDSNVALVRVGSSKFDNPTLPQGGVVTWNVKKETRVDILVVSISLMVIGGLALLISVVYVHRRKHFASSYDEQSSAHARGNCGDPHTSKS